MKSKPNRSKSTGMPGSTAAALGAPAHGPSWLRFGWLLAALAAFLIYIPALGYDFTFDDDAIVAGNSRIQRLDEPQRYLATSWWNVVGQEKEYRPATMASFALNFAVHEYRPFGYHLVNHLLHALNAALVWLLAFKLARNASFSGWIALGAALLFALHPIHIEAVAGVVGRAELQMTAAYLLALLAAIKSRDASTRAAHWGWAAALLPAALLATFSKEQGVTLPAVVAMLSLTDSRRTFKQALLALLPCIVFTLLADAAYFGVRRAVIGAFLTPDNSPTGMGANPLVVLDVFKRRLAAIALFTLIARSLVLPINPSPDYSFAVFNPFRLVESVLFPVGFALLALAIGAAVLYRRQPIARFGIILMLATLAVGSNLVITIGTIFGERLLYLPSAGFALFVAGLALDPHWAARLIKPLAAGFAVWAAAFLVLHFNYLPYWRDTEILMPYAVERVPQSANAQQAWALELRSRGRLEQALEHIDMAVRHYDNEYFRALRAVILIELGRPEGTLPDLERGHGLRPDSMPINTHLAEQLTQRGLLDRAERVLVRGAYANNESSESVKLLNDWRAKHRSPGGE